MDNKSEIGFESSSGRAGGAGTASEQGVRGSELHSAWGWERILLNPKEMFP